MSEDDKPQEAVPEPPKAPWKERFVSFINEKVPNSGICKECGQKAIVVSDDLVTTPVFQNGGIMLGGPTYPQVMLVCTNCGFTRFFNAMVSKVTDGAPSV